MAADKAKNVKLTVVDDDGTEYSCILKPIDRATLGVVMSIVMNMSGNPDFLRAGEIILNTCWISGDEKIKTDDSLFVAAALKCFELIQVKKTKLQTL